MIRSRKSGKSCPGSASTKPTASTPTKAVRRSPTYSRDARSYSFTISCSGRTTRPAALPARSIADGFSGIAVHLENHDVALVAVSRAPLPKLQAYKRRMGWTFPWASSFGTDFNLDYNVQFTEKQQREGGIEYNYRREAQWTLRPGEDAGLVSQIAATTGTDTATYTRERPGVSAFVLENGVVYHSYSAYARGLMACGECISGSTARPAAATRAASGGVVTTSTDSCNGKGSFPISCGS